MGRRRRQVLRSLLLGWLAIGFANRALVQASESSNETHSDGQNATLSAPPSTADRFTTLRGRFSNESNLENGGRVVSSATSSSASKSSSSHSSSIVMDGDPCQTSYRHVCDPDQILNRDDVQKLIRELDGLPRSVPCDGKDVSVQVAVALVSKMDFHTNASGSDNEEDVDVAMVAETFARSIHDKWGVGYESSCGGTGAVLFLAIEDRAMFISRGQALETYLTDSRLDMILLDMRPLLRRQEYGAAVLRGVQEMFRYVESGEPTTWERGQDYAWIVLLLLVFVIAYWASKRDQERRRKYAEVTSQLSELDRAQAEVLQGKYQATSCPICLEPFPVVDYLESSARTGGRNRTCGSAGVEEEERLGSDGMPIKLLRCGHCFDDACFVEWVRTGNGQVDKCPICKAPVGGGEAFGGDGRESPSASPLRPRRTVGTFLDPNASGEPTSPRQTPQGGSIRFQLDPVSTALRMYRHERAFRLGRLQGRYPQFVGPREVQRWSDPSYEGSLARDPVLLNRDPFRASGDAARRSGGGASSASFGGGTSSGGRGGRW